MHFKLKDDCCIFKNLIEICIVPCTVRSASEEYLPDTNQAVQPQKMARRPHNHFDTISLWCALCYQDCLLEVMMEGHPSYIRKYCLFKGKESRKILHV